MAVRAIAPAQVAFLRFELVHGDARRKKVALQELCRLYRNGWVLTADKVRELQPLVTGLLLVREQDVKVVRWGLNGLAQFGQRDLSSRYVEHAIKLYEADPEIVAAGVAALSKMYSGAMDQVPLFRGLDPAIRNLAALQNTDPRKLDFSGFKINIASADPSILKLALIAVGLNRDVENLFDPKHPNGTIVRELGTYPDAIVVQYSVWSVIENLRLSIENLGVDFTSIETQPSNVQSKLLELAVTKKIDARTRHGLVEIGSGLPALEAREGLAKGLRTKYYDGLEEVVIPWFGQEISLRVKELLAEHIARFSTECGPYEQKVWSILEAEPALSKRIVLGAEGTALFGRIKQSDSTEPSLFGGEEDFLTRAIKRAEVTEKKVLMLAAAPLDQPRLRLDEEARDIGDKLALFAGAKVQMAVAHRWAVRTDQIQDAILAEKPNVLHFSGHGGSGVLSFEDKMGNEAPVDAAAFAELIELNSGIIECLVLNACFSSSVADLCAPHLKAVVGCDGSVDDGAAIAFGRAFYRALANGYTYAHAFKWAVNEVRMTTSAVEAEKYILRE